MTHSPTCWLGRGVRRRGWRRWASLEQQAKHPAGRGEARRRGEVRSRQIAAAKRQHVTNEAILGFFPACRLSPLAGASRCHLADSPALPAGRSPARSPGDTRVVPLLRAPLLCHMEMATLVPLSTSPGPSPGPTAPGCHQDGCDGDKDTSSVQIMTTITRTSPEARRRPRDRGQASAGAVQSQGPPDTPSCHLRPKSNLTEYTYMQIYK